MPKTTRRPKAKPKTASRRTGKRGATRRARTPARTSGRTPSRTPTVTLREKGAKVEGTLGGLPMRSVTGQLVVDGAAAAMAWYGKVFGAEELDRKPMPDGRIMHAVLKIGDTAFMVSDSFQPGSGPRPDVEGAYLHIQDRGIDAMWDKALANGAKPVLPLANQFWGDRYGQLRDPWGQKWSLGWPAKMTEAEKERLQQQAMQQMASR